VTPDADGLPDTETIARLSVVDRSRLPQPGAAPRFDAPVIERTRLGAGLDVWTVRHASVPVVTMVLLIARGAAEDPPGKDGLAAATVDMLDEGSGEHGAIAIHEALARVGAHLDSDVGSDASSLTVTVLSRFTAPALALLADIAVRPALTEADFARVRQLRLDRLVQLRDVPGAVADRAFARLLYGSHPYGHTPLGSERTLAGLSVDDVRAFHARAIVPGDATLIVVGDCRHEDVCAQAAEAFAGWEPRVPGAHDPVAQVLPTPSRLNVVARPGAPQSELRIGHVAAPRETPDYYALLAANMVLGGQFVSRINQNLREDKGLTYGARTAFEFRRLPGPFVLQVSVQTDATARAIAESLEEIAAIRGSRPVTTAELAVGVAALTRGYPRNFETAEQVARAVTQIALYDLPDDYFARFVPALERITPEEVTAAAARHLDPDRLTTLVVGDQDRVDRSLAALGLGEPVMLSADAG
jgi:predicted Zn-dependent peptidase